MPDESEILRPIRQALELTRDRLDYALQRLGPASPPRALRWCCIGCGYLKHFTRPTPAEVAAPCSRCKGVTFQAAP